MPMKLATLLAAAVLAAACASAPPTALVGATVIHPDREPMQIMPRHANVHAIAGAHRSPVLQRPADFYGKHHPSAEHVLLVVEVADSSIDFDRQVKVPLYGRNGIPECWLVDLERDHLVVNREPSEGGYRTSQVLRCGEKIAPLAFPDLTISIDDILG